MKSLEATTVLFSSQFCRQLGVPPGVEHSHVPWSGEEASLPGLVAGSLVGLEPPSWDASPLPHVASHPLVG